MSGQLSMFGQEICEDSGNAISSPALESGAMPCGSPDGKIADPYGPAPVPVPASPSRAKAKGLTTLVTSGRYGMPSSASVALEQSLVNKLMERLDTAGSTLFRLTWKRKATPLRRQYWELAALGLRTGGKGCISSVPTPRTVTGGAERRGTQTGIRADGERRRRLASRSATERGAESLHAERRTLNVNGQYGRDRPDSGRSEAHGVPGAHGEVRGTGPLPNPDGRHPSAEREQHGGEQRLLAEDCGAGDDSNSPQRGLTMHGSASGNSGHAALAGATRGFWADCDWWYGRDNKYRPIEPGVQPLAHGATNRVLKLRGYGDAIVAEAAKAFISSFLEATDEREQG